MKNLSRYLIKAQKEERKKIARELHDEIGQILTAIKINLELLKRRVDKELQNQIDENINLINRAIDEVRDISLNLRPSLIDDLGLTSAIKWYVEKIKEIDPSAKVVIVSADIQKQTKELAIQKGALAFINKPVIEEEVLNIIKEISGG